MPGRGAHPGGHLLGAPGRKEAPLRHSGRSGAPKVSHAFSSSAPAEWAKPTGLGSPRASAPSRLIHIHHIHEGRGRGPARPRRSAPDLGSLPGGGSGPSGAPPASASGREFPLGHDSKMCRGRSSVGRPCPRVCLWGLLPAREGAKRPGKGLLLSLGKGR